MCYAIRDIRSICEQSGRTTGRLRSTGLQAMPSEGRHSWHSGAHLPLLSSPGRVTISDDYGPGGAAGGWTSPPPPPASARLARVCCGPDGAAGGSGPERPRGKRTERPRNLPGRLPEAGRPTCQSDARDSDLLSKPTRHGPGICLTIATLVYVRPAVSG